MWLRRFVIGNQEDTMKKKAKKLTKPQKLANALESVANDIESGDLLPGQNKAFTEEGAPVCALGHAFARSKLLSKKDIKKVGPYDSQLLREAVDFTQDDLYELSLHGHIENVTEANDGSGPKHRFSPKKTAKALRKLAEVLKGA